jgi:WS/DGAT/MGAT family acyltransferase
MAQTYCERLTALDAAFLDLEAPGVHMHVGSVGVFDPGPLSVGENGIDFERVLELTDNGLHRAPRFRQKLSAVPLTGHPVWVDDEHFNIRYHVRHTALPHPGDERLLKRLAGRIMSQKLDRTKPMWELWFVEGLPEKRIGVISKIHHCMIDGISGVDLLAAFMGPNPDYRAERVANTWRPRPEPSTAALLSREVSNRVALPVRGAKAATAAILHPLSAYEQASRVARGFTEAVGASLSPGSETPFNQPIGPHRRFDWTHFDLDAVKAVKNRLGGTVNDVVLACVAGAVRDYLSHHHLALEDIDFKVFVPVSTRTKAQRGKLGNRVSSLIARLPVDQSDPARRMRRVIEETHRLKESDQAVGTEVIEELSDWTSTAVLTAFSRLAASQRSYNMVVTNVPGPQFPVFMEGARMLACYPLVPLFTNQALGIALLSYDKSLFWGFNADWEKVPDLHEFVEAIDREFELLRSL